MKIEAVELRVLKMRLLKPFRTSFGVQHFVDQIERKRRLIHQVHAIAGTEYVELLEKLVALLYEKVQPYRDRV